MQYLLDLSLSSPSHWTIYNQTSTNEAIKVSTNKHPTSNYHSLPILLLSQMQSLLNLIPNPTSPSFHPLTTSFRHCRLLGRAMTAVFSLVDISSAATLRKICIISFCNRGLCENDACRLIGSTKMSGMRGEDEAQMNRNEIAARKREYDRDMRK